MEQLRIGILGFGNLGRGAAAAVSQSPDMALAGIFTRRPPEQVAAEAGGMPVCPAALLELGHWRETVENILFLGLPMVEELVFTGRWKAVNQHNRRQNP